MGINENVPARAALLGVVAACLTYISGSDWRIKDFLFVAAVVGVMLVGGYQKAKFERLTREAKVNGAVHDIEKVEFIQGEPVQLARNKVTCILFFGTWCTKSREALQVFACLHDTITDEAVQFVGLTQESREELAMYEVKGRNASNFRELKEFAFSIGIETGSMSKEYLVRCDLFTVPQLFVVGKDKNIAWYGDPCSKDIADKIRSALKKQDTKNGNREPNALSETAGDSDNEKQSNAA